MLVTDRARAPRLALGALAGRAAAAGVDFFQVREKDLADAALFAAVREVVEAAGSRAAGGMRVFVSGRPDVAEAAGAHGVQLPEEGLPVRAVRRAFPRLLVGASCHSTEAAERAAGDGADHVVFGPVFATPGKEARAAGLDALAAVVARARVPVYAIGGVTPDRAAEVHAAGAAGLAAIRPFLDGEVAGAVDAYRRAWASGPRAR
jgi:thiamine-phosphate pyrophosphorylase